MKMSGFPRAAAAFVSAAFLAAPAALAHPGHGPLDHGARHWATSPDHLASTAVLGLALLLVSRVATSPRLRRVCGVGGSLALAGALAVANGRA
jgi:hypothetical protein